MLDNLKAYWKTYLFGLMAIGLVIAISVAVHYYDKSKDATQLVAGEKILGNPVQAPIDSFIDKSGQNHTEIAADQNIVPQAALKDSSVKRDSVIQKIDNDLNLADASHLMEVTQENMQLRAAVLRLKKDSANAQLLAYSDKFLKFKVNLGDSTVQDLNYSARISQVKYGKQKFLSNTPVIDFYSEDPRVTFSGFDHFSVSVPEPVFGLTTEAKTAYLFNSGRLVPSLGIDFRIGNFHLEGQDYYSFKNVRFQQLASFGYRQTIF